MPDENEHSTEDERWDWKESGAQARKLLQGFTLEIDPDRIDESVKNLTRKVRELVDQGRYTKVRIKYKGKQLMPDIPLGVFVATEAVTFWYAGLLRALVVNLGARTIIEVEFVHDASEKVSEGKDLYMEGEVEAAEAKYREALKMKPGDTAASYHLGILLRVMGRREEALEHLQTAAQDTEHEDGKKAQEALDKMARGPRTL